MDKGKTYAERYNVSTNENGVLDSVSPSDKDNRELWDNMQYYMEYCQRNGYVTPKEWIETHKHF